MPRVPSTEEKLEAAVRAALRNCCTHLRHRVDMTPQNLYAEIGHATEEAEKTVMAAIRKAWNEREP